MAEDKRVHERLDSYTKAEAPKDTDQKRSEAGRGHEDPREKASNEKLKEEINRRGGN